MRFSRNIRLDGPLFEGQQRIIPSLTTVILLNASAMTSLYANRRTIAIVPAWLKVFQSPLMWQFSHGRNIDTGEVDRLGAPRIVEADGLFGPLTQM